MSWNVSFIGTPAKITEALEEYSTRVLSGTSKEEFEAALPHFKALLAQNYSKVGNLTLRLTASGHGHDGYNNCYVNIEYLNGTLV